VKLSDYVKRFDKIEKDIQANAINKLTKTQSNIFRDVFSSFNKDNIQYAILDAPSGTGKTTLLKAMQIYCKTKSYNMAVTATTGKASSALGGQTIHSFMNMKMVANENAETKEDALTLSSPENFAPSKELDILVVDESSMIGQKLFSVIDRARFKYVFFVLDSSQLPPVKEKKVNWDTIADRKYTLTKTLRAKKPEMLQLFKDFREYKLGIREELDLMDYINGDSIVAIDYNDMDILPANTESCVVAYRNKLVEHFVNKTTSKQHTMYNLNRGVMVTRMITSDDVPNTRGYFSREFVKSQCYYNGEDVEIIKLENISQKLVANRYATYKNFKLSINQKKTGIIISDNSAKIPYGAKESPEDKFFLSFPKPEILECCTLAIINQKYFVLIWDDTEDEFNLMLEYYFSILSPFLKTMRAIKSYRKKPTPETLAKVPMYIRPKLRSTGKANFDEWFSMQPESTHRSRAWANFLSASAVVSARPTTSRTVYKAQGISIPCVIISDQSFFGASLSAQYVAVTRGKHGIILVQNTPNNWK